MPQWKGGETINTQLYNFSACMCVITVVLEYLHRTLDQQIHVEYYTPTDQYINSYISTFVFINLAIYKSILSVSTCPSPKTICSMQFNSFSKKKLIVFHLNNKNNIILIYIFTKIVLLLDIY